VGWLPFGLLVGYRKGANTVLFRAETHQPGWLDEQVGKREVPKWRRLRNERPNWLWALGVCGFSSGLRALIQWPGSDIEISTATLEGPATSNSICYIFARGPTTCRSPSRIKNNTWRKVRTPLPASQLHYESPTKIKGSSLQRYARFLFELPLGHLP